MTTLHFVCCVCTLVVLNVVYRSSSIVFDLLNERSCTIILVGKISHPDDETLAIVTSHFGEDLNHSKLYRQLLLLQDVCVGVNVKTVHDVVDVFASGAMHLFNILDEVSKLIRLLLVLPSSSCTAERSFSALRRLKTYLRSTMTAERLNSVAVLHIHKEITDTVDIQDVIRNFVSANDTRRSMFGAI